METENDAYICIGGIFLECVHYNSDMRRVRQRKTAPLKVVRKTAIALHEACGETTVISKQSLKEEKRRNKGDRSRTKSNEVNTAWRLFLARWQLHAHPLVADDGMSYS